MSALRALLLLAALCALPAAAPARPENVQVDPVAAIDREMLAYGQWLARLQAIQAPVQNQLVGIEPHWRAALAEASPRARAERFRPVIARALAAIDAATAEFEALDRPDFPSLDLPADVRPAAIMQEISAVNRQIRIAVDSFNPILDAFEASDTRAAETAAARMLASVGLVIESQVVLARANLAATPRDDPAWEFGNVELLFVRSTARVFAAFQPLGPPRVDAALPGDLIALAGEIEVNAAQGRQRVGAEIERFEADLADAEAAGDRPTATILRRVIAVFAAGQAYFPLSDDLAALLRAEAAAVRGRPTTIESTTRFLHPLRSIRARLEEINRQVVANMVAAQ